MWFRLKKKNEHTHVGEACIQKPFTVKSMNASEFYHFFELVKQHTCRKKDLNEKAVLISKATWMNIGQANNARILGFV